MRIYSASINPPLLFFLLSSARPTSNSCLLVFRLTGISECDRLQYSVHYVDCFRRANDDFQFIKRGDLLFVMPIKSAIELALLTHDRSDLT